MVTPGMMRRAIHQGNVSDDERLDDIEAGAVLPTFTVATLPAAATNEGRLVRCSNGAAGSPCLAISDGTNWLRIALGTAVATS